MYVKLFIVEHLQSKVMYGERPTYLVTSGSAGVATLAVASTSYGGADSAAIYGNDWKLTPIRRAAAARGQRSLPQRKPLSPPALVSLATRFLFPSARPAGRCNLIISTNIYLIMTYSWYATSSYIH